MKKDDVLWQLAMLHQKEQRSLESIGRMKCNPNHKSVLRAEAVKRMESLDFAIVAIKARGE